MNLEEKAQQLYQQLYDKGILYPIITGFILVVSFIMILVVATNGNFGKTKAQEQITAEVFTALFITLLVVGVCVLILPSMREFRNMFAQIGNVLYIILFTIAAVVFYGTMPDKTLNQYAYLWNLLMLGLGGYAFHLGLANNVRVGQFNILYERIKYLIATLCFIILLITLSVVNPGGNITHNFGYSFVISIVLAVFAFLYLIVLLTVNNSASKGDILSAFTPMGSYGTLAFVAFILLTSVLIILNKDAFFGNKAKAASILLLLLVIAITAGTAVCFNLFSVSGPTASSLPTVDLYKNSLLMVFGIVCSAMFLFWVAYNFEQFSQGGRRGTFSFLLNLVIVLMVCSLLYKTANVELPSAAATQRKNAFFSLIWNLLLYIPCLVSRVFDVGAKFVVGEYHATNASSLAMLVVSIVLLLVYFKAPSVFNMVATQGGTQLINQPVSTNVETTLGNYQTLNGGGDAHNYHYAISCWIFVDSVGANSSTGYKSLLNFGEKPAVKYNAANHTLRITMQQKDLQRTTQNKLLDFDEEGHRILFESNQFLLQKWNNLILNYNGGTMDIFLNGELVKSSIEVVPYVAYDNLVVGETGGIKGGICNLLYFRQTLTAQNIFYLNQSVKHRDIPVLNDSNATITRNEVLHPHKVT